VLIGETRGWLGQSLYLRELQGREDGAPPPVDLAAERANGDFVRSQIAIGRVDACHDLSDGGLLVALAEMCISGGTGAEVAQPAGNAAPSHAFFYGEDQARYLIASGSADDVIAAANAAGVPAVLLGYSGGPLLTVKGLVSLPLSDIKTAHEEWLPRYMSAAE
jgi:phosphoribosylformylglycinamidine synthase